MARPRAGVNVTCRTCGKVVYVSQSRSRAIKFCSMACRSAAPPRRMADCHPDRKHSRLGLCAGCYAKKSRAQNLEKHRARDRKRYWQNPQARLVHAKRWAKAKPLEILAAHHRRRAALLGVDAPGVTPVQWLEILETFGHRCAYCLRGDVKLTRDHVIAVATGGADAPDNIVPACMRCNCSKGARRLVTWALKPGFEPMGEVLC